MSKRRRVAGPIDEELFDPLRLCGGKTAQFRQVVERSSLVTPGVDAHRPEGIAGFGAHREDDLPVTLPEPGQLFKQRRGERRRGLGLV